MVRIKIEIANMRGAFPVSTCDILMESGDRVGAIMLAIESLVEELVKAAVEDTNSEKEILRSFESMLRRHSTYPTHKVL